MPAPSPGHVAARKSGGVLAAGAGHPGWNFSVRPSSGRFLETDSLTARSPRSVHDQWSGIPHRRASIACPRRAPGGIEARRTHRSKKARETSWILLLGQVEVGDGAVEHHQCHECVYDGVMPHRRTRDACHAGPGQSTLTFMPSRMTEMPALTTRSPGETPEITSRPRDVNSPTSTGLRRITPTPASPPSTSVRRTACSTA